MHKYAYMAWDRNFSYFCDNWRKREFPMAAPEAAGEIAKIENYHFPHVQFCDDVDLTSKFVNRKNICKN